MSDETVRNEAIGNIKYEVAGPRTTGQMAVPVERCQPESLR